MIDKGLGPRAWEDVLEVAGDYIAIVKLGWGTAYVTQNLERKLEVLRDKPVVIGGTFFEVVYAKDKLDEYKRWLTELGLTHVEISDGTIDIPRERKLELIADFARDFTVLSEVGSKDSSVEFTRRRVDDVDQGGARRRRLEGDHRGARGRHRRHLRLVRRHAHRAHRRDRARRRPGELIFEAPTKATQAWFVKQFGPTVNLGNIPPDEVIPLETLRLGLRGDTLKEVLLGGEHVHAS